jgi:hypothetical protein
MDDKLKLCSSEMLSVEIRGSGPLNVRSILVSEGWLTKCYHPIEFYSVTVLEA